MDIALLGLLIILNGVFAMSEIALVTARKSRLQALADGGDAAAKKAIQLGEEPTQFLSTVQIGITAIGVLNGIVGEAAFAGPLAAWLVQWGVDVEISSVLATTVVVVGITYITIVVGELVPKRLAQLNAEGIARLMARPIALLALLSKPFVLLLAVSTEALLSVFGKPKDSSEQLTEEDIHAVLAEGSETGVIEYQEHAIVRNVLRLDDFPAAAFMTPRSEIQYLDIKADLVEQVDKLVHSEYATFPVCKGGLDEVLGVITAKRLLRQRLEGKTLDDLDDYLIPAVFVPEFLTGLKLLDQFREFGMRLVFVVDEYGEVLGIITLQDILEALAGEFKPRDPTDVWAVLRDDQSWLLDGLIPIMDLQQKLALKTLPEDGAGRYHTLSGLLMWLIGDIPKLGDVIEWAGWRFEMVDVNQHRINKVVATPIYAEEIS